MQASIVLDCSFGDGGKGVVVDNLCERYTAKSLVVRFSGGQQCGHTVIRNNKKHIFASFGAGTLYGCETFFTEDTTFYIPNLIREYNILTSLDVEPILHIHPFAMVTTPYDVAANRLLERIRRHGSCGIGVGQTMKRNYETPFKLYAMDLEYPSLFYAKLAQIYQYYCDIFTKQQYVTEELNILVQEFTQAYDDWCANKKYFSVRNYTPHPQQHIIFEGSQGIMLDMDHGVFPNVTFANTTAKNAIKYFDRWGVNTVDRYYVTRCYTTRHGYGWMPNEQQINLVNNEQEINVFNEWQRHFRIGEFDYDMVKHAIYIDSQYYTHSKLLTRKHLVVTCLDQRPDFILDREQFYDMNVITNNSPECGHMSTI